MQNTGPDFTVKRVHVAVAVIARKRDGHIEILLSHRPQHVHQGGLWEFPGGKVEPGETLVAALQRELHEELGINIDTATPAPDVLCNRGAFDVASGHASPLIKIAHDYGDKQVLLDVWQVSSFTGTPHGKEGQEVRWVPISALHNYAFPAANRPIITACRLPRVYAFTPQYATMDAALDDIARLHTCLGGPCLIRLRQPKLADDTYAAWLQAIQETDFAAPSHEWLVADRCVAASLRKGCRALHLSQRAYAELTREQCGELEVGVSCHTTQELAMAQAWGADFASLSPVCETSSHRGEPGMGWPAFANRVATSTLPVYALGGLASTDMAQAIAHGAQGIAAISAWQASQQETR